MTFKKILCLVFALALMVSVMSACGGSESKKPVTNSANGSSEDGTVSFLTPSVDPDSIYADPNWSPYTSMPASSKGATVRVAHWTDLTQSAFFNSPLKTIYNDIGINVEMYLVKNDGYVNEIMTKMAAGDIPDVFKTNEYNAAFPITLQIAAPINKVSSIDLNDPIWDQTMIKSSTIDGNTYYLTTVGYPGGNGNFVFFNKRLFEENSIKSPTDYYAEGTWSWDNFLKCAKEIKMLGSDYRGAYVNMEVLAGSVGTSITKYDFNTHQFTSGLDDSELLKAYQWFADARAQGVLDATLTHFISGKAGLYVYGPHGLQKDGKWKEMDPNDIGFTYLPSFEEGKTGIMSSVYGALGIIDGAPNADAAGYFIRYYMDPKNWNLNDAFITVEAGNFFYEIAKTPVGDKYFNFDDALTFLMGLTDADVAFYNKLRKIPSEGMNTALQSLANIVDEACIKANDIINNKIVEDRQ